MPLADFPPDKLLSLLIRSINDRANIDDIELCLRAGADPNGTFRQGLRPIHYATYENSPLAISTLVRYDAEINKSDDVGYTAVHISCKYGQLESLRELIGLGAAISFSKDSGSNVSPISKTLSELSVTPLNLAIEHNHPECVELLLDEGVTPNQEYFLGYEINLCPLRNQRCLELLLQYGAKPDVFGRSGLSPLMRAAKENKLDATRALLKFGADVNLISPPRHEQKTALHYGAQYGHHNVCDELLKHGAKFQRYEEFGYTPLELAIRGDHSDVCKLLLDWKSSSNELNKDGSSPLQVACSTAGIEHRSDIVKELLEHGADTNYHCRLLSYSEPSLCPIVEYTRLNEDFDIHILQMLLEYGSLVNMRRPSKMVRILDANGVLAHLGKLRHCTDEVFRLFMEAAEYYDCDAIHSDSFLSDEKRDMLLEEGKGPRSLRHYSRLLIRRLIWKPIPMNVDSLPLPNYLKQYLKFKVA